MRASIRKYPTTIAVLVVLGGVYVGQLALAGSVRSGAAYEVASSLPAGSYLVMSPWLHSYHLHLLENAAVFAILGLWTERRMDSSHFGAFVVVTGYTTSLVPPLFGSGFGVGASGITNALWAFFTTSQLSSYQSEMQRESLDLVAAAKHLFLFFVGLLFVIRSIAEFGGFVTPLAGTAIGSHLIGTAIGFGWFLYRLFR